METDTRTNWFFWSELHQRWAKCSVGTALFFMNKGRIIRLGLDGLKNAHDKGEGNAQWAEGPNAIEGDQGD
jgi:hypothetical protein